MEVMKISRVNNSGFQSVPLSSNQTNNGARNRLRTGGRGLPGCVEIDLGEFIVVGMSGILHYSNYILKINECVI